MRAAIFSCALVACTAASETASPPKPVPPRPVVDLADSDREKPASCADQWLAGSTGRVVDDRGEGVAGARVGYCTYGAESAVCLPFATTEEGGWYSLVVDAEHRCVKKLSIRVMPPEGRRLSETFLSPPVRVSRGVLDLDPPIDVHTLGAPTKMPPRGDPNAARTVVFADGLELTFAPDDLVEGDQYEKLSAGAVTTRPAFLPATLELDGLYAFGPAMNVSVFADRPKVKFALPNPKGLAEGTAVEIFVLGGSGTQLDADRAIEEGSFVVTGTGRVERGRIVPNAGSELPALTAVGYRRK